MEYNVTSNRYRSTDVFFVKRGQDSVLSNSNRTAKEALISKMEAEAAKQLVKPRLANERKKGNGGNSDEA